jgi:hypothetical protein
MLPYIAAAIAGAWLVNKRQPTAKCQKLIALGPRTGTQYKVDVFPTTGIHIVHAPGKNTATFLKTETGFKLVEADTTDQMLENFRQDFLGESNEPSKEPPK